MKENDQIANKTSNTALLTRPIGHVNRNFMMAMSKGFYTARLDEAFVIQT